MHRLLLFIAPILLSASLFIVGSQAIGHTRPDIVDHFGFGWCGDKPCFHNRLMLNMLLELPSLPTIGDFVRTFGPPCAVRIVRAECTVDRRTLQRRCRPRQAAVLYPTLMITAAESVSAHGAEFTAEQASESVKLTDLDHNYCKAATLNDVEWRGFIPLDHYWR